MVQFYTSSKTFGTQILFKYDDIVELFNKPVTGLSTNTERIRALDIDPFAGILYAITTDANNIARLYQILEPDINPLQAVATLIGIVRDTFDNPIPIIGRLSIDFNPDNDQLTIVSSLGDNLSANFLTAITTVNGSISGGTRVSGIAYDNNIPFSVSTLFDIAFTDEDEPNLYTQNVLTGALIEIGPITAFIIRNFSLQSAPFDILGFNQAYVLVTFIETLGFNRFANFYSINLQTGEATLIGSLPGAIEFEGLALINSKVPCLHPSTKVSVPALDTVPRNKLQVSSSSGMMRRIDSLRAGDKVIDYKGEEVAIVNNIRFLKSDSFFRIKKHALAHNSPMNDILIRKGHPILVNGQEIDASKLRKKLGNEKVEKVKLVSPVHVWSLCTKERTFVMMEGVPICTWNENNLAEMKYQYTKF